MKRKIIFFGAVVLLFGGAWAVQRRAAAELRTEIAAQRDRNHEAGRRRAEQARLDAAKPLLAELQRAKDDHAAVAQLRAEIDRLRERAEERSRARVRTNELETPLAVPREKSMREGFAPFTAWKNAGRKTPSDAMETALWAAAGGDVQTLAATILLDTPARTKAEAILRELPESIRAQFPTPEDLVALLTVKDVPLGEAHIIAPTTKPGEQTVRVAELRDAAGKVRYVGIPLWQHGDEWRLIVPPSTVDKYAAMLKGTDAGGGGK